MGLNTKKQTIAKNKGIVAAIGRWMPIHNGHKEFLIKLANEYEKIIVIIGSCYENGTKRNCIPSIEREKMIHAIFKRENISKEKYEIVQVPDVDTFEEWIKDIKEVCRIHGVTHFCTGNKEDILNILERSGEKLEFKIINPEEKSNFPYHSTDIRTLITEGKYEEVQKLRKEIQFDSLGYKLNLLVYLAGLTVQGYAISSVTEFNSNGTKPEVDYNDNDFKKILKHYFSKKA